MSPSIPSLIGDLDKRTVLETERTKSGWTEESGKNVSTVRVLDLRSDTVSQLVIGPSRHYIGSSTPERR